MAQQKIQNLLSAYEAELGESIGNIEAVHIPEFDLDITDIQQHMPIQQIPQQQTQPQQKPNPQSQKQPNPQPQQQRPQQKQLIPQQSQKQLPPKQPPTQDQRQMIVQQQQQFISNPTYSAYDGKRQSIDQKVANNSGVQMSTFYQVSQVQNLNLKSFTELFQQFLQRHKQYQNYTKYLAENVISLFIKILKLRESRQEEIKQKTQLIEHCHIIRNEILAGRFVTNLYEFLCNHLQPISFDIFHGITELQYQAQLTSLIESFRNQLYVDTLMSDLLIRNHQVYTKKQGAKKNEKLTKDFLKYQVKILEEEIKYLESLVTKQWVPLPIVTKEEESREVTGDNKDIPKNCIRIQFKRIMMGPRASYHIQYIVNNIEQPVSRMSNWSNKDGIFNYSNLVELSQDLKQPVKDLHFKSIEVRVFWRYHLFFSEELCVSTIKLSDLYWTTNYEGTIPLNIPGYMDCKLEFTFSIREPIAKSTSQNTISVCRIIKKFNSFDDFDQGVREYEGECLPEAIRIFERKKQQVDRIQKLMEEQEITDIESQLQELMKSKQKEKTQQQTEEPQQKIEKQNQQKDNSPIEKQKNNEEVNQQQGEQDQQQLEIIVHGGEEDNIVKQNEKLIPEGLTLQDVLYPENPKLAPVFQFVENYKKMIETQMSTLPPSQRRKLQNGPLEDFMRQMIILGRIAESGDMEKYKKMITGLDERENKLIKFYGQIGLLKWKKVIEYRLELLKEELEGLNS